MHPSLFFIVALVAAQSNVTSSSGALTRTSLIPTFARASSNSSRIIVAGIQGGASYTLDQCNARCASVNQILFTSCGSYQSEFRNQMQCSCSASFYSYVQVCSSCCQNLGYEDEFKELTQVVSACQVIQDHGDMDKISYTTITEKATQTETQTQTNVQTQVETYTAQPTTTVITSIYPVISTVYYTYQPSKTTWSVYSSSMTSVWSTTYTPEETSTTVYADSSTSTTTSYVATTTNTMPIYSPTSNAASRSTVAIGREWNDTRVRQVAALLILFVLSVMFI